MKFLIMAGPREIWSQGITTISVATMILQALERLLREACIHGTNFCHRE